MPLGGINGASGGIWGRQGASGAFRGHHWPSGGLQGSSLALRGPSGGVMGPAGYRMKWPENRGEKNGGKEEEGTSSRLGLES